jgi:iron-sulfur cluster assembly protein
MQKNIIDRSSIIGDIVRIHPFTVEIFMDYGVHCAGCHISDFETLEQGILGHGFTEEDLETIIHDLNESIEENCKNN